jgi:hypothetical protein
MSTVCCTRRIGAHGLELMAHAYCVNMWSESPTHWPRAPVCCSEASIDAQSKDSRRKLTANVHAYIQTHGVAIISPA